MTLRRRIARLEERNAIDFDAILPQPYIPPTIESLTEMRRELQIPDAVFEELFGDVWRKLHESQDAGGATADPK